MQNPAALPEEFRTEDDLDEFLTRPSQELIEFVRTLAGPLLCLGAGGKMGPTLAVRARRAADAAGTGLRIIAVSRFSDAAARQWLEERGVETIAVDLFDRNALARLPDAANVLSLVGQKFGTSEQPWRTWAVNTLVSANIAERYASARIVALSTGNVYPLVPIRGRGSVESDPLTPLGEYANSAVARERILESYSERHKTPMVSLRLNYAIDLRYGVLCDIARRVQAGETIDLAMGYFNCLWQGDANDMIVRSLALAASPPRALNLTGTATLSVRTIAEEFGRLLEKPVRFAGSEAETALLSDTTAMRQLLGEPPTPVEAMVRWVAAWVQHGGRSFGKPTHFEVRDGQF